MSLVSIGDALVLALGTVQNLRVHRYPPESINEFPACFIYARSGTLDQTGPDLSTNFHSWSVDIITQRTHIAQAAAEIEPYIDAVQNALWADLTLGGTVDHIGTSESIRYELLAYEYAGKPVFGYRIIVPVKQHRIIE